MKIGFKRGNKWYSGIIRVFTTSQWSHVGVWIDDRFYESTASKGTQHKAGVRDYLITPEIITEYEWFDCNVDHELAIERYNQIKDCAYDYFSLLSFIKLRVRDSKRHYCYEQALHMLTGAVNKRVTGEVLLTHILRLQRN